MAVVHTIKRVDSGEQQLNVYHINCMKITKNEYRQINELNHTHISL